MTRITIGLPTNRGFRIKTSQCLLDLVANAGKKYGLHIVVSSEGYSISENRSYLAVKALNNNSDYLLMIDDDMTFEPDLLDKLIANDKDIIGVAYHPRNETGKKVKYLDETHAVFLEHTDDPKYKKPFKCYATGTGIILIRCEVFKKLPRPWFMMEFFDTGQCKLGEDWYFCIKAGKHGIEIWTDPTIPVGHIGERVY